ncbi:DNA-processing protein DprA [Alteromonas sp. C1M14]|uniref:DNA-processing protein DprA n=1 Tax=Alteromonas sp. C1M14 TaxID=2841567 RepID=UPI001C090DB5|nr:DNA-processing protein DprA [Alteromonas sp. C1M14]MBU2978467.1 DNA-processing protein DprA [Alteromonas sp. C1M14]
MSTIQSSPQLTAYLAMATVPKMTPQKWRQLLVETKTTPVDLIHGSTLPISDEALQQHINRLRQRIVWEKVESALNWQQEASTHAILYEGSCHWPEGFQSLSSAPLVLFCHGDEGLLSAPQIAIVGSRRATVSGLAVATDIAAGLAKQGLCVTSGLAAGIDAAAHKGAMAHPGRTIAFLGTGPDLTYPHRHSKLRHAILEHNGLIVSEFWPGTPPRRHHFPQRNRLIAAISKGTLVVEATINSGTLITANMAADLGRDVFAVPGNIANPLTEGCHFLIQQGAKLVVSAKDILEELVCFCPLIHSDPVSSEEKSKDENLATDKLLDSVEFDVTSVDTIAERSALPVSEVVAALIEYELRDLVAPVPGGYVKLRGK